MTDGDPTPRKQGRAAPWEPGQSGNPAGRPKGSRNRLSEAFVAALADDFDQHGAEVIRRVREEDPAAYLRTCAALVPKVLKVEEGEPVAADLSDEELIAVIRGLDRQIAAGGGPALGFLAVREGAD